MRKTVCLLTLLKYEEEFSKDLFDAEQLLNIQTAKLGKYLNMINIESDPSVKYELGQQAEAIREFIRDDINPHLRWANGRLRGIRYQIRKYFRMYVIPYAK